MSDASTGSPAGSPSTTTTRALPCDSPAVRKRSTGQRYRTGCSAPELGEVARSDFPEVDTGDGAPAAATFPRGALGVEGVVAAAVVGDVGDLGQFGHLFEQRGLDPLAQRHLRHGATLAPAGQAEVGRAVLFVQGDQVGPPTVAGDRRIDRL